MKNTIIPKGYRTILDLRETEQAIKLIKDYFEARLAEELCLERVSAPRFVRKNTGINDDLNGIETPVAFKVKYDYRIEGEIVQSLAKWKRMALADYDFEPGEGLYTDMDAIRADEELDNLHSVYVDQWDWEKVIAPEQRTLEFLKKVVKKIYKVIRDAEFAVEYYFPEFEPVLPRSITFIHAEDLRKLYPKSTPKEREDKIAEKFKAVFIIGIGGKLQNGTVHDGRAPDYDDWSTPVDEFRYGLNGDIIVWYPLLKQSLELSSMGIRVDADTLVSQLNIRDLSERMSLEWHKRMLSGEFPESVGGGLGQSRLCMFYLRKAHIGEVQASIWPKEVREKCLKHGIKLL
ncbi:aspartate--ammonia ligase [Pseudomonadota bacterium]